MNFNLRTLVQRAAIVAALGPVWLAGAQTGPGYGVDLNGLPVRSLAGPGVQVVVLVFAATDCPISNRYVPEIARLRKEFGAQGVRFWWVFPNPEDTAAIVAQHRKDFALDEETLRDPRQSLVAMAHVGVTPEAAVFAVGGGSLREVYHGRIDDRYLSFGQERPQPTRHDLELAIGAALHGKPAPQPAGPPVGCAIVPLQP